MSFTEHEYEDFVVLLLDDAPTNPTVDWLTEHVRSERDMFQFLFTSALITGKCIRIVGGAPDSARFGVVNAGTDPGDRHTMHVMSMVGASLNDDHDTLSALVSAAITWPEDQLSVMVGRLLTVMYQVMKSMEPVR